MVTYILAAQHGLGRHTDTLEKEDHHEYLKLTFIQALVSSIGGMAFLKLSVGFSLLRLGVPMLYNRILWSLIGKSMVLCKANQLSLLSIVSICLSLYTCILERMGCRVQTYRWLLEQRPQANLRACENPQGLCADEYK